MNVSLSPEDWAEERRAALQQEIPSARELGRRVTCATMAKVFEDRDLTAQRQGSPRSLAEFARDALDSGELPLSLIRRGYIDENFTLYVAGYHGLSVSVSAMNFILHAVQANRMDVDYKFGSVGAVEAVVKESGERLLGGDSVYNVEIFDHLLKERPECLSEPLARLVKEEERVLDFVSAYVAAGSRVEELFRRLGACWSGIFAYIVSVRDDQFLLMLNGALCGTVLEFEYEFGDAERELVERNYKSLGVFLEGFDEGRSGAFASILAKFGVLLEDISVVSPSLRGALVAHSLYPVTATNLATALDDERFALNEIKEADENVYHHVLKHLPDYLRVVAELSKVTISESEVYVEVLNEIAEHSFDCVEQVARGATEECQVQDISVVQPSMWPPLARAFRFPTTVQNIKAYSVEHGIDHALAGHLSRNGKIVPGGDDDQGRLELAIDLANATALDDSTKINLLQSLDLKAPIGAGHIEGPSIALIPELVGYRLVGDDAEAFRRLSSKPWATKEKLIQVSENFVDYLPELELSSGDVVGIASSDVVGDDAKKRLLERLDAIELDEQAAQAVLDWVNAASVELLPEQLEKLREAGASVEPEEAVDAE